MSTPKTAAEALEEYKKTLRWVGDDPMVGPEDVSADAHTVIKLAKREGIDLATLVPNYEERQQLVLDAEDGCREY